MKKIICLALLINSHLIFSQAITGVATNTNINSVSPPRGYIPRFNSSSNIQSSAIYQYGASNYIGINTIANPTVPLQIEANSAAGYGILMNQTGTGQSGINLWNTNSTAPGRNWGLWSTGAGNAGGAGNFILQDVTAGQSRFFISGANGNIGIGTNLPSQKLEVAGNAKINNTLFVDENIEVLSALPQYGRIFSGKSKSVNGAGVLNAVDNTNGAAMWLESLTPNGFAYTGVFASNHYDTKSISVIDLTSAPTPSPISKKHTFLVFGDGRTYINTGSTNLVEALTIGRESTPNILDKNTVIYNNGSAHLTNNLQIGFTSHIIQRNDILMHINAVDKMGLSSVTTHSGDGGYNAVITVNRIGTKALTVIGPGGENFLVNGSGATAVGGGYVPTGYKLAVWGKAIAEALTIKSISTWPDFVFEKNYELMPLKEVEKYYTTNKHLPGIPSETEVKEKGYDVNEMNTILLKKIEELTLYVVNLEKEMHALKTKNSTK